MTRRSFVSAALAAAAVVLLPVVALAGDEARLVLVASATSPLAPLSSSEVRRLYLGVPLTHDGREINALRNAESPVVKEMFLQRVLFMSAQAYERQLAARVYRGGGNKIPEIKEARLLLESLAADPLAVTFMQSDAALRRSGIKILAEL
jgi:hypothetical protein